MVQATKPQPPPDTKPPSEPEIICKDCEVVADLFDISASYRTFLADDLAQADQQRLVQNTSFAPFFSLSSPRPPRSVLTSLTLLPTHSSRLTVNRSRSCASPDGVAPSHTFLAVS